MDVCVSETISKFIPSAKEERGLGCLISIFISVMFVFLSVPVFQQLHHWTGTGGSPRILGPTNIICSGLQGEIRGVLESPIFDSFNRKLTASTLHGFKECLEPCHLFPENCFNHSIVKSIDTSTTSPSLAHHFRYAGSWMKWAYWAATVGREHLLMSAATSTHKIWFQIRNTLSFR